MNDDINTFLTDPALFAMFMAQDEPDETTAHAAELNKLADENAAVNAPRQEIRALTDKDKSHMKEIKDTKWTALGRNIDKFISDAWDRTPITAPFFGQYFTDEPKHGVTKLLGKPVGVVTEAAMDFIPGVAAVSALADGRTPGLLDFAGIGGIKNLLKIPKWQKVGLGLGGAGDMAHIITDTYGEDE